MKSGRYFGIPTALALLCFLAPGSVRTAAAGEGAWAERVQVLLGADRRSVERRQVRVWDFQPEKQLDFLWEPALESGAGLRADGTADGRGKLVWRVRGAASYDPDAVWSTFAGELRNGKPNGRGRLEIRTGEVFEGFWRDGKLEGEGVHVDAAGNRYQGSFQAGIESDGGRLMLRTGAVFTGTFRNGLRDGSGTMLLPGGTRYPSHWTAGVEDTRQRPDILADATIGGLLRADSTGGSAGKVELGIAVDGRMTQRADMKYQQAVRDEDIAIYPEDKGQNDAWNGSGEVTAYAGAFDGVDWDDAPAFVEVDLDTTDGKRVRLDSLQMQVSQSDAYRKPMFSLVSHQGCVGYRPSFTLLNRGWGNPSNAVLSVSFTGAEPDGAQTRAFTVPLGDFSDGIEVDLGGALRAAGADTQKLAAERLSCDSMDKIEACRTRLLGDVNLGDVASFVWSEDSDRRVLSTTAVGTIEYDWSDDGGQGFHASEAFRAPIQLAVISTPKEIAEGGDGFGGPPEARRYRDIHLETGKTDYSFDLPIRGNPNLSSYQARLKLYAPMSSVHQFRIAAKFADGSVRESKPVTLFYFRPKDASFESKAEPDPASCYLDPNTNDPPFNDDFRNDSAAPAANQ